jgi:vancomycin permeability regulator SanA
MGDARETGVGALDADGRRRWPRRALAAGATLVAVLVLAIVGTNGAVRRAAGAHLVDDPADVGHRQVAIVLGAGVVDGRPSPMLAQRVDAAVGLFEVGAVDHLLMTGDNGSEHYDEVTAMRDRALHAGVPRDRVTRDHAGFATYDSCVRARDQFGVTSAVVVTQAYHAPRAVYTCRSIGIDAVGLRLPDWQHRSARAPFPYPRDLRWSMSVREWLATTKAVVDVEVRRPEPRFGGPLEGLGSDTGGPGPR